MRKGMRHLSFCVWLTSLNITFPVLFIYLKVSWVHFSWKLSDIPLCIYRPHHLIHVSVDGHLDLFQFLAIAHWFTMSLDASISVMWYLPGTDLTGLYGSCFWSFWEIFRLIFTYLLWFALLPTVWTVSLSSHPHQQILFLDDGHCDWADMAS